MRRPQLYWTIILSIILVLLVLIFTVKTEKPLIIKVLDVGQGDAIFVKTPSGRIMVVDSGRDRSVMTELDQEIGLTKTIDILENSNPDLDHIGGFPFIMEKYKIGRIISAGTNHEELEVFTKIEELAKQKNILIEKPKSKTVYVLDQEYNVTYTILWPEENVRDWERNAGSIVGLLEYAGYKVLLTGDAPLEVENEIVKNYEKALQNIDILKVGHHGSKTSTGSILSTITSPTYALISAGINNRYGHPHTEVLQNLNKVQSKILVTSEVGTITCKIYKNKGPICE